MIGHPFGGGGNVQHVQRPFLIARILINRLFRWWRWIGQIFVEVDLAVDARQRDELAREPRQSQEKPDQQPADVSQRLEQGIGGILNALQ